MVRYGNVMGSKGSVIPLFLKRKELGGRSLPITDKRMTRFIISNQEVVTAVEFALEHHLGVKYLFRRLLLTVLQTWLLLLHLI